MSYTFTGCSSSVSRGPGRVGARRLMQWWFALYLRVASIAGYAIVWTAHDLLPHAPVFADDQRAHRDLLSHAALVIALSGFSADELVAGGARLVRTIPFGTYCTTEPGEDGHQQARSSLGLSADELVVVHLGKIPLEGTDLLLLATQQVPDDIKVKVFVVGACLDPAYRRQLEQLADGVSARLVLRLERVSEEEMSRYLSAADVAVFPFRAVTNSSSILNAQCFGLPVIIPDLVTLRDIPSTSAVRFDGSVGGLALAMASFARLDGRTRGELAEGARRYATSTDWPTVARMTLAAYRDVVGHGDGEGGVLRVSG